jgi:hypothetical protein
MICPLQKECVLPLLSFRSLLMLHDVTRLAKKGISWIIFSSLVETCPVSPTLAFPITVESDQKPLHINLSIARKLESESVKAACFKGKLHQLHYAVSLLLSQEICVTQF